MTSFADTLSKLPPNSFIASYLSLVKDMSPPMEFQFWAAVAALSSLSYKFILDYGGGLRTNLYILLVAEPGVGKSTSMNIVKSNILAKVIPQLLTAETASVAGITREFQAFDFKAKFEGEDVSIQTSPLSIYAEELHDLLECEDDALLKFITSSWNAPIKQRLTNNNETGRRMDSVPWPTLTFFTATTREKYNGYKQHIINQGLSRRLIQQIGRDTDKRNPWLQSTLGKKTRNRYEALAAMGRRIESTHGVFYREQVSQRAFDFYVNSYNRWLTHGKSDAVVNANLKQYWTSRHELLLKLTMLLSLSRSVGETPSTSPLPLQITLADVSLAEEFLCHTESELGELYMAGENKLLGPTEECYRLIERAFPDALFKRDIFRHFKASHSVKAVDEILTSLEQQGRVKKVRDSFEPETGVPLYKYQMTVPS